MDFCSPRDVSVSEDLSSFCALSLDHEIPSDDKTNLYVNDIGNCFAEFLNIQNKEQLDSATCISIPYPNDGRMVNAANQVEDKDTHEFDLEKLTNEKCLSKCATFPSHAKNKCSTDIVDVEEGCKGDLTPEHSAQNGHTQSINCPYPHSTSLPTPLKLVSALKGSREKQGAPPRKLTVTWAADVYDPIPTSVSHVPSGKPQRYRSDHKKNGKKKQKGGGKASQGSRGKDKKQSRKCGGSSNRSSKPVDNGVNGACSSGPSVSTLDIDVGTPDPFCGHSFRMKSVTPLHFPVTEAT